MHIELVPLIALLFVFCVLCQWVAWRVRLPPILFLLLTGITAGPLLGLVDPEKLLGELFFPFVSLSVAIILFEGSLTLTFQEIRGLQRVVRNLVSVGLLITWLITSLATKFFLDTSWEVAVLFGAIMVVTGPTVIAPILRTVRPTTDIANILKWESIVIDPIGASLAVLVFEFIIAGGGQEAFGNTFLAFSQLVILGSAIGCLAGYLLGLCLRFHLVPEFLHNITTLGLVFASFALANYFQPEAGLVTVTVFGVWLANMKGVDLEHILAFKETLSILLISLLFIILAARLDFSTLQQLGWNALLICLVIQFITRPLNIFASAYGASLSIREKYFLAWIAPRGIVAAAISSLFSLKLEKYGYGDAVLIVPLTFMVIIFTVLLQSLTAVQLARRLRVQLPDPDGYLIIGSNHVARTIAKALIQLEQEVIVTDSDKDRIAQAESEGIPAYLGNPISEHAEHNLKLHGVGTLLALSAHENENVAASFHYREEFGKKNIYTLLAAPQGRSSFKLRAMPQLRGKTLFGEDVGYSLLSELIADGAVVQKIALETPHETEELKEKYGHKAIPLFAVDEKNTLHFFTAEHPPQPDAGWILLFLSHNIIDSDQTDRQT